MNTKANTNRETPVVELPQGHRAATPADAAAMAELVNLAGEGLPMYLWAAMAEGEETAFDVGVARAQREQGSFSYINTTLRVAHGEVAAALIGYPLAAQQTPANYSDMPPLFVPLQQLEDSVPGYWYLNVLATYPAYRGRGYASDLIGVAETIAVAHSLKGVAIIVADTNTAAARLYAKLGYRETGRRPMVKEAWVHPGREWVLLVKDL